MEEQNLTERCTEILDEQWRNIQASKEENTLTDFVQDQTIQNYIRNSLIGPTKTYHYVLLTQLLAKTADPNLDCRSVQAKNFPYEGAFDARTIAHKVVVLFDGNNQNVLGGSSEPYVNNPLRVPGILPEYRNQQKDKTGWDQLVFVLEKVEASDNSSDTAKLFLQQLLKEILDLTQSVVVAYPTPRRISLYRTLELMERFLSQKSGGERLEVIATALFRTLGLMFGLYDEVHREKVNAADASSGMSGDIECKMEGRIVLAVEVRDKQVTITQIENSLLKARTSGITELLFLAQKGIKSEDAQLISERQTMEFNSGQNFYMISLTEFANSVMILLREEGRSEFLRQIGVELDRTGAGLTHRKTWANLLKGV